MSESTQVMEEDQLGGAVAGDGQSLLNQEQFDNAMNETEVAATTVPACSNCGHRFANREVTVCERCGYYASLGTFVEVDPWDDGESGYADEQPAQISHVQVWVELLGTLFQRIPRWGWFLFAAVSAVVFESLVAVAVCEETSRLRMHWSLIQLALGGTILAGCHLYAYVTAAMKSDEFSPIDVIMSPFALWYKAIEKLPKTQIPVIAGASGLVAMVMSVVTIGAIPYERLLDWGIEKPPEQNLLAAVVAQAKEAKSKDQTLEEAMNDFTGDAALDEEPLVPKETRNVHAECVVVGFRVEKKNPRKIASLVLAAEGGGKLIVVGAVSFDVPEENEKELTQKLFASQRKTPFVNTTKIARWVEPKFVCKVSCVERLKSGKLVDPVLDRISAELDLGL